MEPNWKLPDKAKKKMLGMFHSGFKNVMENISHDRNKQLISFNINPNAPYLPFQLLPFYEMSVIAFMNL